MQLNEKEQFFKALDGLFSIHDKEPKPEVFEIWWGIFKKYPLLEVRQAMAIHAERSPYLPKPAEVLNYVASRPREITAEEAWAHVPKTEADSGFVTRRMLHALGTVEDMLYSGDMKGAQIHFVKAYNNSPPDNNFQYTLPSGIPFEDLEARRESDFMKLESSGWIGGEALLQLAPPRMRPELQKRLVDSGLLALEDKS